MQPASDFLYGMALARHREQIPLLFMMHVIAMVLTQDDMVFLEASSRSIPVNGAQLHR